MNGCILNQGVDSVTWKSTDNLTAGVHGTDEVWADADLKSAWYRAYGVCVAKFGDAPVKNTTQADIEDFDADVIEDY